MRDRATYCRRLLLWWPCRRTHCIKQTGIIACFGCEIWRRPVIGDHLLGGSAADAAEEGKGDSQAEFGVHVLFLFADRHAYVTGDWLPWQVKRFISGAPDRRPGYRGDPLSSSQGSYRVRKACPRAGGGRASPSSHRGDGYDVRPLPQWHKSQSGGTGGPLSTAPAGLKSCSMQS